MFEETQGARAGRRVGPYRTPGQAPTRCATPTAGWRVFLIDGAMVLLIAATVFTIGQWSTVVDEAAHRFLGF